MIFKLFSKLGPTMINHHPLLALLHSLTTPPSSSSRVPDLTKKCAPQADGNYPSIKRYLSISRIGLHVPINPDNWSSDETQVLLIATPNSIE